MSKTTIDALGFSWITNSQPAPCTVAAPPVADLPNYNSNLWLPANVEKVAVGSVTDALQLTLAQNSGCYYTNNQGQQIEIWAAAQAVLDLPSGTSLNYGKIVATIAPVGGWAPFIGGCTEQGQNTSTTLGIFTFDQAASAPFNEIDIVEVGYQNQNQATSWINTQPGGPTTSDAQFCVQPWDGTTPGQPSWDNVNRIGLNLSLIPSSNEVTFMVDWQAGSLTFNAAYGKYTALTFPTNPPITWTVPPGVAIPVPTTTMSLYINLWPYGGPTTGNTVQFVVTHLEVPTSN